MSAVAEHVVPLRQKERVPRYGEIATALADLGYLPVPIKPGEKRPPMKQWQQWRHSGGNAAPHTNDFTGILTGHGCIAIDMDVTDPELAEVVDILAQQCLGKAPIRVGKAPKRLRLYKYAGEFRKQSLSLGAAGKIEIMGTGQQVVAFAIHPDTREPYLWTTTATPLNTPCEDLTSVEQRHLDAFLAEVSKACPNAVARKSPGERSALAADERWSEPVLRILIGEELHDSIRDLAASWIGAGMPPGAAVQALRSIVAQSSARIATPERWQERYDDILRAVASAERRFTPSKTEAIENWLGRSQAVERKRGAVTKEDFYAYLPAHRYLHVPTRELWPPQSVDGNIPADAWPMEGGKRVNPSRWLDQHRAAHQTTWHPGEPMIVEGRVVAEGGWVPNPGAVVFNLYRAPEQEPGDPTQAQPWRDHLARLYGRDAAHIEKWLAHRVQRPGEKCNHALVLGGNQGVGKDSLLKPVERAVGAWNVAEVSPSALLGRFNPYLKSVILRISEARDLGDMDRFALYDRTKTLMAAPPDVLTVDEKNIREHKVFNVTGVIVTTNHLLDGIYLPADDRRHFVAWSESVKEEFPADYWRAFHRWLDAGGNGHVAAYLRTLDLSDFDSKATPPRTAAFDAIVQANHAPGEAEVADCIDHLGKPPAFTLKMLEDAATQRGVTALAEELKDRKYRRQIPHRLERAGYLAVRNPDAADGLWVIGGRRQTVYAERSRSEMARHEAVRRLLRPHS